MKRQYKENYNSPTLVDLWGDFIDWKKRRKGENEFLPRILKVNGCEKIIDASLGDGCDSIYLIKKGFKVVSNEVDSLFIEKALMNARKTGVELSITSFDWREFDKKFPANSFDAIILLGNSLTYLFSKRDQLRALTAFRNVLREGGVLLVDERNYCYMLKHRKEILENNFKYSKNYVYCGDRVNAKPAEIQWNKVVMKYEHVNGKKAFLVLYPFKRGELKSLLKQSGFKRIRQYSDYKKGFDPQADFFQYVVVK